MISPELRALSSRHHVDPSYYQSNTTTHTVLRTGTSPRLPPRRPPPPPPPRDCADVVSRDSQLIMTRAASLTTDPLSSPRPYYRNNFIISLDRDAKDDTSANKFHTFCKKTSQRLSMSRQRTSSTAVPIESSQPLSTSSIMENVNKVANQLVVDGVLARDAANKHIQSLQAQMGNSQNSYSQKQGDASRLFLMNLFKAGLIPIDQLNNYASKLKLMENKPTQQPSPTPVTSQVSAQSIQGGSSRPIFKVYEAIKDDGTRKMLQFDFSASTLQYIARGKKPINISFNEIAHHDVEDGKIIITLSSGTSYQFGLSDISEQDKIITCLASIGHDDDPVIIDDDVLIQGYLDKKGPAYTLGTKKRYVKVTHGKLSYYKMDSTDNSESPLNTIVLNEDLNHITRFGNDGFTIVSNKGTDKEFSFMIPKGKLKIDDIIERREEWVTAVKQAYTSSSVPTMQPTIARANSMKPVPVKNSNSYLITMLRREMEVMLGVLGDYQAEDDHATQVNKINELMTTIEQKLSDTNRQVATQPPYPGGNLITIPDQKPPPHEAISSASSSYSPLSNGHKTSRDNSFSSPASSVSSVRTGDDKEEALYEDIEIKQISKTPIINDPDPPPALPKKVSSLSTTATRKPVKPSHLPPAPPTKRPPQTIDNFMKEQENIPHNNTTSHYAVPRPPVRMSSLSKPRETAPIDNSTKIIPIPEKEPEEVLYDDLPKPPANTPPVVVELVKEEDKSEEIAGTYEDINIYPVTQSSREPAKAPIPPPAPHPMPIPHPTPPPTMKPPPAPLPNTPRIPSLTSGAKNSKQPQPQVVPKVKVFPIHWQKVPPISLNKSVWKEMSDMSPVIDVNKLEELFATKPSKTPTQPLKRKANEPKNLLDAKRSQNLGIFLHGSGLQGTDLAPLLSRIKSGDSATVETITTLKKFIPTRDDIDVFSKISKQEATTKLDKADRFMWYMVKTPFLAQRLQIVEVTMTLPNDYEESKDMVDKITAVCNILNSSSSFLKFLEIVLSIGNMMNASIKKTSPGFKLSSTLPKLANIKSPDKTVSLLDFIVEQVISMDDRILEFVIDLDIIHKTSTSSIVSIAAEVEMLRQDIIKLTEQAKHFRNFSQNNNDHELDPFVNDVNAFVDFFQQNVLMLLQQCVHMKNVYMKVLERFGESPNTASEEFLKILSEFLTLMVDSIKRSKLDLPPFLSHLRPQPKAESVLAQPKQLDIAGSLMKSKLFVKSKTETSLNTSAISKEWET